MLKAFTKPTLTDYAMNYWSILVTILKIFAGMCWLSLRSRRFAFTISLNAFSCRNEDTRNFAVTLLNVNGISLSITFLIFIRKRDYLLSDQICKLTELLPHEHVR